MAIEYRVLGQSAPSATTNTNVYTVPSGSSVVISSIVVTNRGSSTTYRIAIRPAGATLANEHYIAYDAVVPGTDSIFITSGITLAATDVVTVYAGSANLSFSIFGTVVS